MLTILIKQTKNPWWDDVKTKDKIETRDDILLAAMINARKEITSLMARDTDQWQWGKLHKVGCEARHWEPAGSSRSRVCSIAVGYQVGGGPAVVECDGVRRPWGVYRDDAPAMRMLIDLGDLDASRWVNQSGVSGHAFNRHYDDQTKLWVNQQLWPFVSTRGAVEARAASRQELLPAAERASRRPLAK